MAACACCGAVATSLARCGRCQWVAYCSKDCQLRHWKLGGHRALCASLRGVAAFRERERRFWATRSPHELKHFAETQGGLDPASMCFYGEVLFVLAGLKPCLFFSNLPPSWRQQFVADVVMPSGVLSLETCPLALHVVAGNVQTPAEYALQDTLVLINSAHPVCATIDHTLHLSAVALDGSIPVYAQSNEPVQIVQERELARLLDYPIALDECVEPMIEVGYFAVAPDGSRQLLSSYCASAVSTHATKIRAHFQWYQQHVDAATLNLAIETMPLS